MHATLKERDSALKSFKSGLSPILVASDAASWCLDVQNIGHVINYDLPKRIEGYIQRIRRTKKHGLATSFFTESDQPLADHLAKLMNRMKQDVPDWLVWSMLISCNLGEQIISTS
jgi:ATP-dependent RNA helicase DDX3X